MAVTEHWHGRMTCTGPQDLPRAALHDGENVCVYQQRVVAVACGSLTVRLQASMCSRNRYARAVTCKRLPGLPPAP